MHRQDERKGCKQKDNESDAVYRKILETDVCAVQKLLANAGIEEPTAFTYPFGAISDETDDVLRSIGFAATFSCYERINAITPDPDCLYQLGRYNRPSGIETTQFMIRIGCK